MNIVSLYYFLPLIPILYVAWLVQHKSSQCIMKSSKTPTKVVADDALDLFLKQKDLGSIETVKSDDYSQNEYVESQDKIFLSPDVLGSVDVCSIALALRAGAQAEAAKKQPLILKTIDKLRNAQTLLFWVVFCLLAFGIMTASLVLTIVGYVLLAIYCALSRRQKSILKSIDDSAVAFVKAQKLLAPEQTAELERVVAAERKLG